MKKILLFLLLACCFATVSNAQENEKETVAVYLSGEISDSYKKIISSRAVSRISRSKEYVAVERTADFLNVLTKEQDYQLSGEVDEDQIAAIGKRFAAQYVAVFEVSEADGLGFISARLIDVENGIVKKSVDASRKVQSAEDWIALTNNVAFRVIYNKSN